MLRVHINMKFTEINLKVIINLLNLNLKMLKNKYCYFI